MVLNAIGRRRRRTATKNSLAFRGYFVGTRRFSSSSKCWTTTRLVGAGVDSVPARLDHQKPPAVGAMSYFRPTLQPCRYSSAPPRAASRAPWRPTSPRAPRRRASARRRREIEQLLPAPRPERLPAAAGGHLPAAPGDVGKRPHVDLERPESFASYASQRPSGETSPFRSVNGVCTSGVTSCAPSSRSCITSLPVLGLFP